MHHKQTISALKSQNMRLRAQLDRLADVNQVLRQVNSRLCNQLAALTSEGRVFGKKRAAAALGVSMRTLENWMAKSKRGDTSACPPWSMKGGRVEFLDDDILKFKVTAGRLPWYSKENVRLFSNAMRFSLPTWNEAIQEVEDRARG